MPFHRNQSLTKALQALVAVTLLWGVALAAPPTVVVSIQPYVDVVRRLAGDEATVIRILPNGASPHSYEPTPRDASRLATADLVVLNGGLDEWLRDLVAAAAPDATLFTVIDNLDEHGLEHEEERTGDAGGDGEGKHGHGDVNPHVWLDPLFVREILPALADSLAAVDPARAERYRANAAAFAEELRQLDGQLREILEPAQGAPFVPFHDAWPHFAQRYGLDLLLEIEPFPGREPSPGYIAEVLRAIEESGARAIFNEVGLPTRPAQVLADEAGVAVATLDPLGRADESYPDLLLRNALVIVGALVPPTER